MSDHPEPAPEPKPPMRSAIFDFRGAPEDVVRWTNYVLDHMDGRWEEFGLVWLGGSGWPTDEVFLMPCSHSDPGPPDVVPADSGTDRFPAESPAAATEARPETNAPPGGPAWAVPVEVFAPGEWVVCISAGRPEFGQRFQVTKGNYDVMYGGPMIQTDRHPSGIAAAYFTRDVPDPGL